MTEQRFAGRLITDTGDGPPVEICLDNAAVRMQGVAGNARSWPAQAVAITAVSSPRFQLDLDGEQLVFEAASPSAFMFEFVPALLAARQAAPEQPADGQPEDPGADQPASSPPPVMDEGLVGAPRQRASGPTESTSGPAAPAPEAGAPEAVAPQPIAPVEAAAAAADGEQVAVLATDAELVIDLRESSAPETDESDPTTLTEAVRQYQDRPTPPSGRPNPIIPLESAAGIDAHPVDAKDDSVEEALADAVDQARASSAGSDPVSTPLTPAARRSAAADVGDVDGEASHEELGNRSDEPTSAGHPSPSLADFGTRPVPEPDELDTPVPDDAARSADIPEDVHERVGAQSDDSNSPAESVTLTEAIAHATTPTDDSDEEPAPQAGLDRHEVVQEVRLRDPWDTITPRLTGSPATGPTDQAAARPEPQSPLSERHRGVGDLVKAATQRDLSEDPPSDRPAFTPAEDNDDDQEPGSPHDPGPGLVERVRSMLHRTKSAEPEPEQCDHSWESGPVEAGMATRFCTKCKEISVDNTATARAASLAGEASSNVEAIRERPRRARSELLREAAARRMAFRVGDRSDQ